MLKGIRSKVMRIANRMVGQGKARAEAMLTAWRIIRYKALRTKINGTSFDNRQNVLQLLCKYNPADVTVKLQREANNAFDRRNAAAVIAVVKGKVSAVIGYLPKVVAKVIMRKKSIKELISAENLKVNSGYALNTDDLDELQMLGNGDTLKTLMER